MHNKKAAHPFEQPSYFLFGCVSLLFLAAAYHYHPRNDGRLFGPIVSVGHGDTYATNINFGAGINVTPAFYFPINRLPVSGLCSPPGTILRSKPIAGCLIPRMSVPNTNGKKNRQVFPNLLFCHVSGNERPHLCPSCLNLKLKIPCKLLKSFLLKGQISYLCRPLNKGCLDR